MIKSFTRADFKKYASDEVFDKIVDLKTIPEFLNHIKKYGSLNAIAKVDGTVATYTEFYEDIQKVCYVLNKNGIEKNTNVGVYCHNNYEFACAAIGIMAYGCVATLIPFQLDDKTLFGCTKKYNLSGLLYGGPLEANTALAKELNKIFYYKISDIFSIDSSLISENFICDDINEDDSACIIMTGGTTGKSKGALLSHTNLMCGTINGCYGLKDIFNQTYYSIMPLTHVFGFVRNLLTSLYTGSVIYFNQDKQQMFKDMAMIKPTVLVVVPALAELFLKLANQFGMQMLGGDLKTIICGGASVPPYLVQEFTKKGITFCPGYGLTELANMVSGNPNPDKYPASVGMLFPDLEAKLVSGELWLKGRNLMKCYYGEDEENKNAFEDGWFKTGDLAEFDENNNLYIIGRIKDIIVLANGENVSPAYIESKVNEIPYIQDSLVYKTTNDFGNVILALEVVLRQSEIAKLNLQREELEAFVNTELNKVNEELQSYERFSKIIIRDTDFQRSPSMKIIRPKENL